ncbi:hypothetical protein [Pelotomaculum propionicicum]|uniref:Uncharacterized protein n=1 Tax=Pelotomaculum propionicicum TaxID=258475 RepID=A0A4Y7RBZ9_9FIRM|nr:hypothetical protein [Pelotomaculum propionicicum]TEB06362.1 hypothetical protein Pmgp_03767 [Pelotomaculum propionicicum]
MNLTKIEDRFNAPYSFSFKDVLAITFSGTFLFFCCKALSSKDALPVVQALVPLIGIILGGYFVSEAGAMWFGRSQGMMQQQYGVYGGYSGYMYPTTNMPITASEATTQGSKPTI